MKHGLVLIGVGIVLLIIAAVLFYGGYRARHVNPIQPTPTGGVPTGGTTPSLSLTSACVSSLAQLSASPSDAITKMPYLTNGALQQSIVDHNQLAYVIATAEWETGHFQTMFEYYNSEDDLNEAYDGELGNGAYPSTDGFTYRGRGYVQLTGRGNYQKMGSLLGLDLVDNPDLAADPTIAGRIAGVGMSQGLFTGVSLSDYITTPSPIDFVGARAVINGTDQASTIAGYATNFAGTLGGCGESFLK